MSFQTLTDVSAIVLGLVVGSYLNVVICYLLLRGRCRQCGASIPWRYPLVEALTAACFFLSQRRFDTLIDILVASAFSAVMIVLAMIDLEHYLLPDRITKPGILAGLILQFWVTWSTPEDAVIGVLLGAGVLAAVTWGWYWWKGVHGMGFGDIKMLAMVGAFLGWQGVAATLLLASLVGSIVGLGQILRGRMSLRSKLPFGVFLALGAVVTLFYGRDLVEAYLDLVGLRGISLAPLWDELIS